MLHEALRLRDGAAAKMPGAVKTEVCGRRNLVVESKQANHGIAIESRNSN
jgi:hypothetical protein